MSCVSAYVRTCCAVPGGGDKDGLAVKKSKSVPGVREVSRFRSRHRLGW